MESKVENALGMWKYTKAQDSSSAINFCYATTPVCVINRAVRLRSSPVPHSLSCSVVSVGQISNLSLLRLGQSCRMCSGDCFGAPQVQAAESLRPILWRCALRLQCPVLSLKIVAQSSKSLLVKMLIEDNHYKK